MDDLAIENIHESSRIVVQCMKPITPKFEKKNIYATYVLAD